MIKCNTTKVIGTKPRLNHNLSSSAAASRIAGMASVMTCAAAYMSVSPRAISKMAFQITDSRATTEFGWAVPRDLAYWEGKYEYIMIEGQQEMCIPTSPYTADSNSVIGGLEFLPTVEWESARQMPGGVSAGGCIFGHLQEPQEISCNPSPWRQNLWRSWRQSKSSVHFGDIKGIHRVRFVKGIKWCWKIQENLDSLWINNAIWTWSCLHLD